MPFPLIGERVRLRALEMQDLDVLWQAYKDLELELITSGDSLPVSDAQVKAFWQQRIEAPSPDIRYFVIEALPGQPHAGQFAGMCNLYDVDMRNRHAELAIWLASQEMRGLGYGTDAIRLLLRYAFEVPRLDKVHLGVYEFNEGGIRSYERVGFRYEGRLRQMLYYKGRYWDEFPMRILRTEWDRYTRPPSEGLRRYHPNDQENLISFMQGIGLGSDMQSAHRLLRRWWRQIDTDLYCFQSGGQIVGCCQTTVEPPFQHLGLYALADHRSQFEQAVAAQGLN